MNRRSPRSAKTLSTLDELIVECRACPRLVAWREAVATAKRASFRDETYWARPVPGFGPDDASILVVGLAPAANGANRTGRMFTGDRSGDFLFAALHRVGMANQPTATAIGDGLTLYGVRLTSPVRCAPPDNRPTPLERRTCAPFLAREIELLSATLKVVVVLGAFGWQALLTVLSDAGWEVPRPRPKFAHGVDVELCHPDSRRLRLLGCYHVSQHNTFTGRLTPPMLEDVLRQANTLARAQEAAMSDHPTIRVRRIYDDPDPDDGARILVDRLWPRGMSKDRAHLDEWCKTVAPSTELRKWYGHDPAKFAEFAARYRVELTDAQRAEALADLRRRAEQGPLTLLTAAKRDDISEASVLAQVLGTAETGHEA